MRIYRVKANLTCLLILFLTLMIACNNNTKEIETDPSSKVILTKSEANVFYDYANQIMNVNRFLHEFTTLKDSNEAYMFIHGFLMGLDSNYNTELMGIIETLDDQEFNNELKLIVATNTKLQNLIYELDTYYMDIKDQELPQNNNINTLLKQLSSMLEGSNSEELSLYNITSNPRSFVRQLGYNNFMDDINQLIDKIFVEVQIQ